MFIEKISKNDRVQEIADELNNFDRPVMIYGNGLTAMAIIHRFGKSFVKGCIVDSKFYNENSTCLGVEVFDIEKLRSKLAEYNIIIANGSVSGTCDMISSVGSDNIYIFHSPPMESVDTMFHSRFLKYKYIKDHQVLFEQTYNLLDDEYSKQIMISFLNIYISGASRGVNSLVTQERQYFNSLTLNDDRNEVLIDCGAFDGDSVEAFVSFKNNRYSKIYCFEPDIFNYKQLMAKEFKRTVCINKGAWETDAVLKFNTQKNMRSAFKEDGLHSIEVTSIDNTLSLDENVTFIKMDIEGSELSALKGATKTIARCSPKLAICVYHRSDDLITIPQYITNIPLANTHLSYKFYLRHHCYLGSELVFYAIPVPPG